MKRIVYLLLTLIIFAVSVSAQNLTLEDALNRIPFSKIPYQERGLPIGHTDGCLVNRYDGIDGNMYEDLQCRESDLAKGYADFTPEVYLKIKLFDDLYLGALSFGGCTEYRTDVMFLCDANGHVSDTLECCVLNGDLAVKQYEVKSPESVTVWQMFFDSPASMKWAEYSAQEKNVTGYIQETTYYIAGQGKFLKTEERRTNVGTFPSSMLLEHNLWEPEAFGMKYPVISPSDELKEALDC